MKYVCTAELWAKKVAQSEVHLIARTWISKARERTEKYKYLQYNLAYVTGVFLLRSPLFAMYTSDGNNSALHFTCK